MKRLVLQVLCGWALIASLPADPLKFLYQTGDQYRYYGTSTQRVSINGAFVQDTLQEYRVSYSVVDADPSGAGRLQGHIVFLSQREGVKAAAVSQEFDTDYKVDAQGNYTVPDTQVMPVVRNVPTFPPNDLKPGDTWTGRGEEVHDLSDNFGIPSLLRIPVDVAYTYDGPSVRNGQTVQVLRSDYNLYKRTGFRFPNLKLYPLLMTGFSHQTHYFNAEKGREEGYEEEYRLILTMNTGEVVEYSGRGESHLVQAQVMDKPALVDAVKKSLENSGMPGVEVKAAPRGVVINLDNIRFPGESSDLVASEREKVRLIGEILKRYPDRDILVEGHTADVASAADPQVLSEARAAAVGNELLAEGVRRPDQIVYRGWGATRPLVPNDTPENRAKNRRVEITLLEN